MILESTVRVALLNSKLTPFRTTVLPFSRTMIVVSRGELNKTLKLPLSVKLLGWLGTALMVVAVAYAAALAELCG